MQLAGRIGPATELLLAAKAGDDWRPEVLRLKVVVGMIAGCSGLPGDSSKQVACGGAAVGDKRQPLPRRVMSGKSCGAWMVDAARKCREGEQRKAAGSSRKLAALGKARDGTAAGWRNLVTGEAARQGRGLCGTWLSKLDAVGRCSAVYSVQKGDPRGSS